MIKADTANRFQTQMFTNSKNSQKLPANCCSLSVLYYTLKKRNVIIVNFTKFTNCRDPEFLEHIESQYACKFQYNEELVKLHLQVRICLLLRNERLPNYWPRFYAKFFPATMSTKTNGLTSTTLCSSPAHYHRPNTVVVRCVYLLVGCLD